MEANDLPLPAFDVPLAADAPRIAADSYARWISQNIARLRDSGQLDRLCAARLPVNARFRLPEAARS